MSTRQATQAEWREIVATARKSNEHIATMLEAGHVNFVRGDETLTPPAEVLAGALPAPMLTSRPIEQRAASIVASTPSEPTWKGKTFDGLTFSERHVLHDENPALYRAMRDAHNTWRGKEYDDCSPEELVALYRESPERFARMRGFRPFTRTEITRKKGA